MAKYFRLIFILSLTLSGDTLFSVAVIWTVLLRGGSEKSLAFFLCIVTLVAFLIQRLSKRFKQALEKAPGKSFIAIRVAGVICSLGLLVASKHQALWLLYFSGMLFTVISFLSQITVEAIIGQEVLSGRLSSNKASRILQTALQISAFLGAALTGFVLNFGGMAAVLAVNAVTYASGMLIFFTLRHTAALHADNQKDQKPAHEQLSLNKHRLVLWLSFIGLCFLMLQVSAFNFLVPLIAQHEKAWTATEFGFIDALAGLGAFMCTLLSTERGWKSMLWAMAFLIIPISDAAFHFGSNAYWVAIAAGFIGFFANIFRIKMRELIYDSVSTAKQIMDWAGRITVMSTLLKAGAPLILAFIVLKPSMLFVLVGCVAGGGILIATILVVQAFYKPKRSIPIYSVQS
ncbi:MAG: MFS transporter [Gammaproteobacteria bacterium]|nr:MFS transporter [Gammaproteobacteria bacterium]